MKPKKTLLFLSSLFLSCLILTQVFAKDAIPGKETLSILYFDNLTKNKEYDWLSNGITDMLISDIAETGAIDVVERANLKKVLDEQQLSMSGLIDDKKALELGKLMSAAKLIYGSYIIQGKIVIINGKITDTESGKIITAFSVKGAVESILSLQNELSQKTKTALGIKDSRPLMPVQEYSFEAVKKYYQGIDLLDKGAAEDARKKFEEATRIDPTYIKPYQGIEESYKFLKNFTKMRQQREIAAVFSNINKIQIRLKEKPWRTFAEIALDPRYENLRKRNSALYEKEMYSYYQGDTPAICTWNLQNNIFELAKLYEEYFDDKQRAIEFNQEIISITEKSRTVFAKDVFFPEVLYSAVRAAYNLERWPELKDRCEELMNNYPDYRMMWAIEDFYKKSLEKMSKK
jgi:TolB-like protein